jgi:hypothetical protein
MDKDPSRGKRFRRIVASKPVRFGLCTVLLTGVLLLFTRNGRHPEIIKGFYYWKNTCSELDGGEKSALKDLQVQKLYVKFFEVDKDAFFGSIPIAKTELHIYHHSFPSEDLLDTALSGVISRLEIIPTVFVKNEVLYSATKSSLDSLADNIDFLVCKYYRERFNNPNASFSELQIDCDWTIKTKDNYFYLLNAIRRVSGKTLSCTLRLYPYKYPELMGTPPVDKVTLMCYNLLSPLKCEDQNSILDNTELESYLKGVKKYPLHIDIALPVFSWMQAYRGNTFAGMINPGGMDPGPKLAPVKPLWYEVQEDVELGNMYLRAGDRIKWERVTEKEIDRAIALIRENVPLDGETTVTLFHLDTNNLNAYNDEALLRFYSVFAE